MTPSSHSVIAGSLVVTPAGWVFLSLWAVLGLIVGLVAGAIISRDEPGPYDDTMPPGMIALTVWAVFPLVVAGAALFGLFLALDWTAERVVEPRIPNRQSREQLQQRIRELEREVDVA